MIDKWLKAGVLENGLLQPHDRGLPARRSDLALLANIYLHHVLDEWFEREVRPRLKGNCTLSGTPTTRDGVRESSSTPSGSWRCWASGLDGTGSRSTPTRRASSTSARERPEGTRHPDTDGTTFDFLGFTHVWGQSRKGKNMVRQVTAKEPFRPRAGRGERLVPEATGIGRSATSIATCPPCCGATIAYYGMSGNMSAIAMVRPSGRADMAEVVVAAGSPKRVRWSPPQRDPEPPPAAPARIVHRYAAASETLP